MSTEYFIEKIKQGIPVSFPDTMAVIAQHYDYLPTEFSNGLGEDCLINAPGTNEGSCKIFAFAKLNNLNQNQTLNLFGDYYRMDVLQDPGGTSHQNIRTFMKYGWEGIQFKSPPLTPKACP